MTSKLIYSVSNQDIKHLAKLISQRNYRRKHQQIVVEGIHLLQTFMDATMSVVKVYIPQHCCALSEVKAIMAKVSADKIVYVADDVLSKISSLQHADEPTAIFHIPTQQYAQPNHDVVILENVQDPGNVGTILRSSAATGIADIVFTRGCADIWSPKVLRSAMGAHAFLRFHEVANVALWCQQYGHMVYATVLDDAARSLYSLNLTAPAAWVFGNEGSGISTATCLATQQHVIIPMTGATESLNVAMAASICLFEQQRQRLI